MHDLTHLPQLKFEQFGNRVGSGHDKDQLGESSCRSKSSGGMRIKMEAPFLLSLILTLGLVFLPRTLADVTVSLKPGKVSELIKRCVCVCVNGGKGLLVNDFLY